MDYKKQYEVLAENAKKVYGRITGGMVRSENVCAFEVIREFEEFYEKKFNKSLEDERNVLETLEKELNKRESMALHSESIIKEDAVDDFIEEILRINIDQGDTIEDFKQKICNL